MKVVGIQHLGWRLKEPTILNKLVILTVEIIQQQHLASCKSLATCQSFNILATTAARKSEKLAQPMEEDAAWNYADK